MTSPGTIAAVPFHFENRLSNAADPAQVFDVLAGLVAGADEEWFPDFREAHWQTAAPHGVGSVREYRLSYARMTERIIATWRARRTSREACARLKDYLERNPRAIAEMRRDEIAAESSYTLNPTVAVA